MQTLDELFALAWQNHQAGYIQLAAHLYRQMLQLDPAHSSALTLLGAALADQGKLIEAVTAFRQLVHFHPDNIDGHNNLAATLCRLGEFDEALIQFQEAARINPSFAPAYNGLGIVLKELGRSGEALGHFQHALQLDPGFASAHANLGDLFRKQGRLDEAIASLSRALQIDTNFAEAHNNLGVALREQGRLDAAAGCYIQALRIRPDFAEAHNNLGNACQLQGQIAEAMRCYREALRIKFDLVIARSNLVSCLNYDSEATPELVFAEHCRWGQVYESAVTPARHLNDPTPDRPLRIGYVSPDFRRHALERYIEPVLANHDPARVQVYCFAEVAKPDEVTERLQRLVPNWRWTTGLNDSQLAQRIREDGIDILVDLSGHTAKDRLSVFAHKPAPVQATWLGYMNTTGLNRVDYRLTDAVLDPPGQPILDTEDLVRLPDGFCCFAPPADAPAVASLPALQLGHITFGSLHNRIKLNAWVFDLWSLVLQALPYARLLMFHHTLTNQVMDEIRRHFATRGITTERLDLRQGSASPGYLGIYNEIDISLDTLPCTGGVTTCEALWMGVPVLTLAGTRPAGRNSAALLTRVGLSDWVAQTREQYVALAVQMASDMDKLARLRKELRDQTRSTLCDARRFTHTLEDAYRTLWRKWCEQQNAI